MTAQHWQDALIHNARSLKSEHGENPEYDRGLLELTADTLGYPEEGREVIAHRIGVNLSVLYPPPPVTV